MTELLGQCQVRSGTDRPCQRPAVVKIRGIPFCEPCAHEQEAYFTIGELTEEPRRLRDDERLVGMLDWMRRTRLGGRATGEHESDAA
jgi:hypothetical protein